jgi:hypothetical protein
MWRAVFFTETSKNQIPMCTSGVDKTYVNKGRTELSGSVAISEGFLARGRRTARRSGARQAARRPGRARGRQRLDVAKELGPFPDE